jgi:hypothetical protein
MMRNVRQEKSYCNYTGEQGTGYLMFNRWEGWWALFYRKSCRYRKSAPRVPLLKQGIPCKLRPAGTEILNHCPLLKQINT